MSACARGWGRRGARRSAVTPSVPPRAARRELQRPHRRSACSGIAAGRLNHRRRRAPSRRRRWGQHDAERAKAQQTRARMHGARRLQRAPAGPRQSPRRPHEVYPKTQDGGDPPSGLSTAQLSAIRRPHKLTLTQGSRAHSRGSPQRVRLLHGAEIHGWRSGGRKALAAERMGFFASYTTPDLDGWLLLPPGWCSQPRSGSKSRMLGRKWACPNWKQRGPSRGRDPRFTRGGGGPASAQPGTSLLGQPARFRGSRQECALHQWLPLLA
jgi:hypothetical protein